MAAFKTMLTNWIFVKLTVRLLPAAEKPGTSRGTHAPLDAYRITPIRLNNAAISEKNDHASALKCSASLVVSSGTNTGSSVAVRTMKTNCGSALEAKKASVSALIPILVTTYHVIKNASAALQVASAASLRLSLINK